MFHSTWFKPMNKQKCLAAMVTVAMVTGKGCLQALMMMLHECDLKMWVLLSKIIDNSLIRQQAKLEKP